MQELFEMLQAAKVTGLGTWGVIILAFFWVAAKLARGTGTKAVSFVTDVLNQGETIRRAQAEYIKQLEERVEWLVTKLADCQGRTP